MEESHRSLESLARFKNLLTSVVFICSQKITVVSKLCLLSNFLSQHFWAAVILFLMAIRKVCEKRKQTILRKLGYSLSFHFLD